MLHDCMRLQYGVQGLLRNGVWPLCNIAPVINSTLLFEIMV
jgi:hypothetical protein